MPASVEFFKRFPNTVFVETGTYLGEGVEMAIAAGFAAIRSVELSPELYRKNAERFSSYKQVRLFHGSSEEQLWEMIKDVREPITFWLDAHYSGGITVKGREMSPILKEIAIIGRHPIKTHTILIDDRRQTGTADFDFVTEGEIHKAISAINAAYKFSAETGSRKHEMFVNDVIVAKTT